MESEKTLEEPGDTGANTVQGPMGVFEPCDVCGGDGKPPSGFRCICDGTGKLYIAAINYRKIIFDYEKALSKIEQMPWPNSESPYARIAREALSAPSLEPDATKSDADSEYLQSRFETGGRNALNLQMAARDVLKWFDQGARFGEEVGAFVRLRKCLSENGPKSSDGFGFPKSGSSSPATVREQMEGYGAWREADDLIIVKLPGLDEFRISNEGAARLHADFAKICPSLPSGIVEQPKKETDLGEKEA